MNTACVGVKGHGVQNVPGAWYDLTSRLDAVCAVLYGFNETLPSLDGMTDHQREQINRACGIAVAAETLLEIVKQDADRLEMALKTA